MTEAEKQLSAEAVKRLTELSKLGDTESEHVEADRVLCDLLTSLGFVDVVKAWDEVGKWYA